MIRIFTEHITPRHKYIFDFIFEDILGMKYIFIEEKEDFDEFNGPKFSYGKRAGQKCLHFQAHPLLSETGVRKQETSALNWEDLRVFFPTEGLSEWPFDPFALAFYLVTRYEEYLPFEADEYGRFPANAGIATREGFLDIPLVDTIALRLRDLLIARYPQLEFPGRSIRFVPTFDIDIAFAHLGKGFPRAILAWLKLIITARFGEIIERLQTIVGNRRDPYDNFRKIEDLTTLYGFQPVYFVLLGDFGKYDRNISYKNKRFRKLLASLAKHGEMGLHPSFGSFLDQSTFLKEKERLEDVISVPAYKNRFHFLRFKFPESFQILVDSGIREDYSMGYSTANGLRASTCTSFYFYNLVKEEKTALKIHPFIFMDTALIDQMNMSPEQAATEVGHLLQQVMKFGGEAIGIWHNYSLSEKGQYKGWWKFIETVLKQNNFQSL